MSTADNPFPRLPSGLRQVRELAGAVACGLALDPSRGPAESAREARPPSKPLSSDEEATPPPAGPRGS